MNMCAVAGLASSGTRLRAASIFRSASASPYGLPAISARAGIGRELPRARDRHLDQHRRNRREDHHRQQRDRVGAAARDRRGRPPNMPAYIAMRASIMIAAAIVAATELIRMSRCLTCASSCAMTPSSSCVAQHLHDALGRRHRRVLRVPPGRERVRRRVRNDVDLRHRQSRLARQPLRHLIERVARADLLRAVHAQDDLVREPVRPEVHQRPRTRTPGSGPVDRRGDRRSPAAGRSTHPAAAPSSIHLP